MAALAAAFSGSTLLQADVVKLKNGGEIRGTLVRPAEATARDGDVTIDTLTGARVTIAREDIQFVTRRSAIVEDYETRARSTPQTVDDQWELAEWCRKNNLTTQRDVHLNAVLDLDPEHKKAHYALGHTLRDGQWMTRDEVMASQGLVKYKGKYVTPQELELLEKSQAELEAEREWFKKVRLWYTWLTGRSPDRRDTALGELKQITDPDAVAALAKLMRDDENPAVRQLYVDILKQIPGGKPVPPLVVQSLNDVDYQVRYQALNAIPPELYAAAVPLYVEQLNNDLNVVVRRAAEALGRMADEKVVPRLIDALVTSHRYKVQVPKKSMSFGTDGSVSAGGQSPLTPELIAMLNAGQFPNGIIINKPLEPVAMQTITVKYDHQNAEVLAALRKISGGEDFGYDKRNWQLWWNAKKTAAGAAPAIP
jgi:hypothetical protein